MAKVDPQTTKKGQSERFIEMARALGSDEDEAAFERTLRLVSGRSEAPAIAHASDCATHNGPAFAAGPCDCGAKGGR